MATSSTPQTKRRAANLLRDYYGIGSGGGGTPRPNEPPLDPTDPDSPSFDKDLYYKTLLSTSSLSQLLSKESQLITEIRELDGERQSLVYNHHHELVAASDTIRNMKTRAESLDPSLESLRSSFSAMSRLCSELESLKPSRPSSQGKQEANEVVVLDPIKDLEPIVTLPIKLRDLIVVDADVKEGEERKNQGLAAAERLWSQMESVLSAWSDAGVPGVREIASDCRAVLREGRKSASGAAGDGGGGAVGTKGFGRSSGGEAGVLTAGGA
ncbi:hypothetical protein IE53DRAFT_310043 [Violaceomyces palustris]|uniref:Uncharacterized protein n=1 Tax=Violaceomyces palustris TaxID=1673888 RepID=A0ACD0P641_9BASI|nr:hypothetical protein IE53DRAFT_310043 [Violaceomyces palustris]